MKFSISILCIIIYMGCVQHPPMRTGLEGRPLPSFSFRMIDSITSMKSDSIEKGRPFMIFYFDPDCPYCRAQLRDILKHNTQFENIPVYMLSGYPYADVKKFADEFKLSDYNNIITGIDDSNYLFKYFNIPSVPYTAIYDKEKKLKQVLVGKTDHKILMSTCLSL